jgi:hypothetical protein
VRSDGSDDDELVVRGWQRAGALVRYFNPSGSFPGGTAIAIPGAIFASASVPHSRSLRPQHTVRPLAKDLGLTVNACFAEGQEQELLEAARAAATAVLICWHHNRMDNIASLLGHPGVGSWDDERFDLVWVFDRANNGWRFEIVGQKVLPGDA